MGTRISREEFLSITTLETALNNLLADIFELEWDDDNNALRYSDGCILEWDDHDFTMIEPIPYEDDFIDGVLYFGDGTIEFHYEKSCEAENWSLFSEEVIKKVIHNLSLVR